MFEVFFDLETQRFFDETGDYDPTKLGVSVISTYAREIDINLNESFGEVRSFWESEIANLWSLFRRADRIIGFNTLGFDVPVLKPYAPSDFAKLPHFDIYAKIKELNDGRAASLNKIAKETLGTLKVDDPANAIKYWRAGDPASLALLKHYCEGDVFLTRDVYDFALKNKFIKFVDRWNNPRTVPVDFSYPSNFSPLEKQVSLF